MPDIKLGPAGNETILPKINWAAGGDLELPVGYKKHVDKSTALDGSVRVNVRANHQKSFTLEWGLLTQAQVLALRTLAEIHEPMRFQNNWVDATWRWVWVASFDYEAIQSTFAATAYYRASMEIEEQT